MYYLHESDKLVTCVFDTLFESLFHNLYYNLACYFFPFSLSELLDIEAAKDWPCKSGQIQKTLRFDPLTSQTSGLFVAKFTKLGT